MAGAGTGKTLIGRAIASNMRATFFNISASSLTSKWCAAAATLTSAHAHPHSTLPETGTMTKYHPHTRHFDMSTSICHSFQGITRRLACVLFPCTLSEFPTASDQQGRIDSMPTPPVSSRDPPPPPPTHRKY